MTQSLTVQQHQQRQVNDIKVYLEQAQDKLAQVLPKYLTPERLVRVAVAAMSRSPKLMACTRESLLLAIMEAGQLGLEAGSPLGHAYLVPFENKRKNTIEATLIIGYKGMIELARRSGQVASSEARVVYERDAFDVEFGLNPKLTHRPFFGGDRGQPVLAYAVIKMKGDGDEAIVEVMTRTEIEQIRARSKSPSEGPWVTDWEAMARKTVMRRAMKYAPMPTAVAEALAYEERGEGAHPKDAGSQVAAPAPQWGTVPAIEIDPTVLDDQSETEAPPPAPEPPAGDPRTESIKARLRATKKHIEVAGPDGTLIEGTPKDNEGSA